MRNRRHSWIGIALAAALASTNAVAHQGHEHEEAAAQLPPPPVVASKVAGEATLPAHVIVDPRRDLSVAVDQTGVLEAPPGGFPAPGHKVTAGQVLGYLHPAISQSERRDLESELALAKRDVELGKLQVKRYAVDENQKPDIMLPTQSLQTLLDYRAAQVRQTQYASTQGARIAIVAPASGDLVTSIARQGLVVTPGLGLFEVAASGALAVESQYTNADPSPELARHARTWRGEVVDVAFQGATFDAARRTHRAVYEITSEKPQLAIGEPLQLVIEAE